MNVSLAACESEAFKILLTFLSKETDDLIPESGDTIRRWLMAKFATKKDEIKRQLREDAVSTIHISFDF